MTAEGESQGCDDDAARRACLEASAWVVIGGRVGNRDGFSCRLGSPQRKVLNSSVLQY